MKESNITLRFARKKDTALILEFIRGLADYEHLLHLVEADEEKLKRYIFKEKKAEVIIAEYGKTPAGFALFFHNFSTFLGRPGIYIEDLFVRPEFRGKGLGKMLLSFLARLAIRRECGRLEWACLDWNESSIQFYKSQGASPMDEWTVYRVAGAELTALANYT
ncbi:MAG: GNAT family N-acetyltransferase [Treponema sp.]|jgi:GNAT superfamily N-acetyltransferase|nr:GNAT family N-acetyltransferase [Treponema sp.]